ncbi:MAG TPA: response regulator [Leptospiraceae bacterium]|nr:response regulator [Leptospiraceae bacterium]HMY31033.1 response regulator [Leptospiraceae bacterium]HMZ65067.1 response regulator [Leptospiraceae bacterium]HNA05673.1 response regulator [Leptospiraceae bacterium]HNC56081.1 response regulator [Leptospiraceae bacterium]
MKRKRILLAEDDQYTIKYLSDLISNHGYHIDAARDGLEALNYYKQDNYPVILTDLNMPKLNGLDLVKEIRSLNEISVIIVLSNETDIERVISVMREGVYDYLIKPPRPEDILIKINHAYKLSQLNLMKFNIEKERELRLNNQLNWMNWVKTKQSSQKETYETVLQNLKHSLNQGAGIGTIVSLIDILKSNGKLENDKYIFPKKIIELLYENGKFASNTLERVELIAGLGEREIHLEPVSVNDLIDFLNKIILAQTELLTIKQQRIVLSNTSNTKSERFVRLDQNLFQLLISEILVNAMKFSEENTAIYVLFFIGVNLTITVLSPPNSNANTIGVPPEMESLCLEPFFRVSNVIDERYRTLEMGLGLTMAHKIMKIHSGNLEITNIKNYLEDRDVFPVKVQTTLTFPLDTQLKFS